MKYLLLKYVYRLKYFLQLEIPPGIQQASVCPYNLRLHLIPPKQGNIILKTLMMANFCLSGSLQSTRPGQFKWHNGPLFNRVAV